MATDIELEIRKILADRHGAVMMWPQIHADAAEIAKLVEVHGTN